MLAVVISTSGCTAEETGGPPESGESGRQASQRETAGGTAVTETTSVGSTVESRCYRERKEELRIGDFEPPPEDVPEYEIVEDEPTGRDGAEAARLLVDTRARSKEDFTLITREIKAEYAELDAVLIEFTDSADVLTRNGSAAIFNTPCGSDYIGYVYRPPNNEGYRVTVPKDQP